ncbi:pyruvate dehydrogenase (acetyl-transferring) E1 component subunit alpha [Halalkalicoccus ordinarius]|uniref:pyruvate dehydrogenase (acetyl-transferring) E1 component subunit alpha n=1 Tax=Halalkalicoccus ordinarius TaxID=3116651 RepID=UPI00300F3331
MPSERAAEFTINHVQVLDREGNVDEELDPDLSEERLLELYRGMKRARRLDERAIALQRRGESGTIAPALGQEAAQVGSAVALAEDDWMVPSFRENAAYLARGTPPHALLWYAMGMEEGAEIPDGQNDLPPSIAVGSQAIHAAGLGWAQAIKGEEHATIGYFGDGATSEGDVYEGMNCAGVYDAHTVFFCQNNQYAISVPREKQTRAETIAQKAIAAGITGVQVDGNDVLGVHRVVEEALEMARKGEPVLVEAMTYRQSMHTTADDPSVYREREEEEGWEERDPIDRFETYLEGRGILDDETREEIEEAIEEELAEAVERAQEGREEIDPAEMFDHVFSELPPELESQRAAFGGEENGE